MDNEYDMNGNLYTIPGNDTDDEGSIRDETDNNDNNDNKQIVITKKELIEYQVMEWKEKSVI